MKKDVEEKLTDFDLKHFMLKLINDLKKEIIIELKAGLAEGRSSNLNNWIKSADVKKLLNVSHGKLQVMRNSRTISFTKIGGTLYYNVEDIQRMMEKNLK